MEQQTKAQELADQYRKAQHIYENAQLGPRTDKANQVMEAVVRQADKLGIYKELEQELGY